MTGGFFYCSSCGAIQPLGIGLINCRGCGHLGLRGFNKRPIRVTCSIERCRFIGWDDGGVNDDLGQHMRREHTQVTS